MMIKLSIVMAAVSWLSAGTAVAERARPNGATCKKDLECESKKCGLTHGNWICMARPARSSPAPVRSTPRDEPRAAAPEEPEPPSELAARCRTAEAAYRKPTRGNRETAAVLVKCGSACDAGVTASCGTLTTVTTALCADMDCKSMCSGESSPSRRRAFGCDPPRPRPPVHRGPPKK